MALQCERLGSLALLLTMVTAATLLPQICSSASHEPCATTCAEENCKDMTIRYGKYCGIGHGGCPGEEPCDPLDACCQKHDDCAMKHGIDSVSCHKKFKKCMAKVAASGEKGFSSVCPLEVARKAMDEGMDIAIMLAEFGQKGGHDGLGFKLHDEM